MVVQVGGPVCTIRRPAGRPFCASTTTSAAPTTSTAIYPDFVKISEGFGVKARRVARREELAELIARDGRARWTLRSRSGRGLHTEHVLPMIKPGTFSARKSLIKSEIRGFLGKKFRGPPAPPPPLRASPPGEPAFSFFVTQRSNLCLKKDCPISASLAWPPCCERRPC